MALVFVGTYTEARTEGVFVFRLDAATGGLTPLCAADAGTNPTYLALHPTLPLLYAANEAGKSGESGGGCVTALAVEDAGGRLTVRGRPVAAAGGAHTCHVSLHPGRRHLLAANYAGDGDGSVCTLELAADGVPCGLAGVARHTPGKSHAHCILAAPPGGRFVLATDLGHNRIYVYRFDATEGTLTAHSPPYAPMPGPSTALPRGAGPRHLTFSADGRFLYCVNEYASTVTAFAWDGDDGTLTEIQTSSTLPTGFAAKNTGAAIHLSPDGRYLYASNRGHDSLAVFSVEPQTGMLTPRAHTPTGGGHPRDFAFTPNGRFVVVANRDAGKLAVFRVDGDTGDLVRTEYGAEVPRPVCVRTATEERFGGR